MDFCIENRVLCFEELEFNYKRCSLKRIPKLKLTHKTHPIETMKSFTLTKEKNSQKILEAGL